MQSSSSTLQNSQRVGFLDLPRELRDEIYAYCFFANGDRHPEYTISIRCYNFTESARFMCSLGLLTVCKSVSEEARLCLYSRIQFESDHELELGKLHAFLLIIGKENRSSIRTLKIRITCLNAELRKNNKAKIAAALKRHRGPCLGSVIELLARGHSLQALTVEFEDKDVLTSFFEQKMLVSTFVLLRGVGDLSFEVRGQKKDTWLREKGLWDVFKNTVDAVQTRRSDVQELPSDMPVVVRQTHQFAEKMLKLVNDRRGMVEELIAAEKTVREHEMKSSLAKQRVALLQTKIAAIEADMGRFTRLTSGKQWCQGL